MQYSVIINTSNKAELFTKVYVTPLGSIMKLTLDFQGFYYILI